MARPYMKKTGQRRQEERTLTVRATCRETPDLDKLTELLIRFALQETGQRRTARATEHSTTGASPLS